MVKRHKSLNEKEKLSPLCTASCEHRMPCCWTFRMLWWREVINEADKGKKGTPGWTGRVVSNLEEVLTLCDIKEGVATCHACFSKVRPGRWEGDQNDDNIKSAAQNQNLLRLLSPSQTSASSPSATHCARSSRHRSSAAVLTWLPAEILGNRKDNLRAAAAAGPLPP